MTPAILNLLAGLVFFLAAFLRSRRKLGPGNPSVRTSTFAYVLAGVIFMSLGIAKL